ncbi:MAG: type IV toxin-antitoxin system AbiEi family antitoxin domain-containing protein [Actinomycetota bacterium]
MYDAALALGQMPPSFTTSEAAAAGISRRVLSRLVRRSQLIRVQQGVYQQNPGAEEATERWRMLESEHLARSRAALLAHPCHALSHQSAALVMGLPVLLHSDAFVHLTALMVQPRSRRVADRVLHHSDSISNEVVEVGGFRLLSPDRTVADCLRTMRPAHGVAIADQAVRSGATTIRDVQLMIDAQRRWRGRPKAAAALRLVDPRRETWLESYSFVTLHSLGIDLPSPQVEVFDELARFVGRVDGMWISDGVVAEADGPGKYLMGLGDDDGPSGRAAALRVVAEKSREDDLRCLGLELVRWDTQQIRHQPLEVARRVAIARSRGDVGRFIGRLRVDGRWLDPSEHR